MTSHTTLTYFAHGAINKEKKAGLGIFKQGSTPSDYRVNKVLLMPGQEYTAREAELLSCITALEQATKEVGRRKREDGKVAVLLCSGSNYSIDGASNYMREWRDKGFKCQNGQPRKHWKRWEKMIQLEDNLMALGASVTYRHVMPSDNIGGYQWARILCRVALGAHTKQEAEQLLEDIKF